MIQPVTGISSQQGYVVSTISTLEQLRTLYDEPKGRVIKKQLDAFDKHCKRFIELSRFVVVSTSDAQGGMDASPRGGESGFAKCCDEKTLLIPDWPGNNRLDTFSNILETGRIASIFFIPGVDEVLRVNGSATLRTDENLLALCKERTRAPKLVIVIDVEEVFLHCAKAIMRSKLWSPDVQVERSVLPTIGQMLKDQIGSAETPEDQEAMLARYERVLY